MGRASYGSFNPMQGKEIRMAIRIKKYEFRAASRNWWLERIVRDGEKIIRLNRETSEGSGAWEDVADFKYDVLAKSTVAVRLSTEEMYSIMFQVRPDNEDIKIYSMLFDMLANMVTPAMPGEV